MPLPCLMVGHPRGAGNPEAAFAARSRRAADGRLNCAIEQLLRLFTRDAWRARNDGRFRHRKRLVERDFRNGLRLYSALVIGGIASEAGSEKRAVVSTQDETVALAATVAIGILLVLIWAVGARIFDAASVGNPKVR
jgi:hypothetical protein